MATRNANVFCVKLRTLARTRAWKQMKSVGTTDAPSMLPYSLNPSRGPLSRLDVQLLTHHFRSNNHEIQERSRGSEVLVASMSTLITS